MDEAAGIPNEDLIGVAREVFRRRGLRSTRQRELIYAVLAATKAHPTAEELHDAARAADPGLSLATVYNTLDTLTETGLIQRLPSATGSGPARYDADTEPHAHLALDDGRVLDVPEEISDEVIEHLSPIITRRLETEFGVKITGVQLQFRGRVARGD